MEFPLHKSPILVALSVFLLLSLSHGVTPRSELVDGVCKQTVDSAKCSVALRSNPRAESAKELNDLAKIALDMAISNANATLNSINKMIANETGLSPDEQQAMKQCAFWYEGVVNSFRSGLTELDEDIESANYDVLIAGDDANNCETELSSDRARLPLISEKNAEAKLFSNIAGVITDGLGG